MDAAAKATEGFRGSESWQSFYGKILNATYYWESLAAFKEFSGNANHLEAKKQYSRWYDGYHIVVSEVIRSYGDDTIEHATPNDRNKS